MRYTISAKGMRQLEGEWMEAHGVPGALLMEHAAQGIVAALKRIIPDGTAVFLCGPGNNGGDGYAAARLWHQQGGRAMVLSWREPQTRDAVMNDRLCHLSKVPMRRLDKSSLLSEGDVLVDALLGIGLDRPVEGELAELIRKINGSGKPVLAVDIPSGLSADTGKILGNAVQADQTVTFHQVKTGMVMGDGPECCGEISVHPILIGQQQTEKGWRYAEPGDLRLIPPRPRSGHKGTFGKAVLVAGSMGMAGAAAAAANACICTGAGLTYLACWQELVSVMQHLAPGAICIPLAIHGDTLSHDSREALLRTLSSADACAIGCGMGFHPAGRQVLQLTADAPCPVVWDADALTWMAQGVVKPRAEDMMTPHPGECARLLGCSVADVCANPEAALEKLLCTYGCSVLLKGHRTLMTDGKGRAVNVYGTPAMAKGGSGDVLTGILAALLCRRASGWQGDSLTIMQLGAMVHGLAGERAAASLGENSVTMERLIAAIDLRPTSC